MVQTQTRLLQVGAQPCLPDHLPLWLHQPLVVHGRYACLPVGLREELELSEPISTCHIHQREGLGSQRLLLSWQTPPDRSSDP